MRAEGAVGRFGHQTRIIFGWLVLAVIIVGFGYFSYRVWQFVRAIESGKLVSAPTLSFSAAPGEDVRVSGELVERSAVEVSGRPSEGPEDARLTIVEFGDFECPYCQAAAPTVRKMMLKYGDRVHFVFRQFPIESLHPEAMAVAEASECAHEQGKFWAFHDKILLGSTAVSTSLLSEYGQQVGLDMRQFERCLTDRRYRGTVQADMEAGREAGVIGTPTFFFNGQRVAGDIPEGYFDLIIQQMLQ